jgi:hypothetical protein
LGPKTFTTNATDRAGNNTTRTNTYYVVYNFILTPPKSPSNGGSTVLLQWQLTDANNVVILDLTSLVRLKSYFRPKAGGSCTINTTGPSVSLYSPTTGATGGSFNQLSSSFRFSWASPNVAGCYTIEWQLKDNAGPAPSFDVLNPSLLRKTVVELK